MCFAILKRKASFTVELSLLMPGIMAVLVFIIYLGYYCHDRCVIERAMYSAVLKAGYDDAVNEHNIYYYYNDAVDGRLIGKWRTNENITISGDEIRINVNGYMECFSGAASSYLAKALFRVDFSESSKNLNEVGYLMNDFYID